MLIKPRESEYTEGVRVGAGAFRLPWWLDWPLSLGWFVRGLLDLVWGR